MKEPLFSIIIVSLNAESEITATLDSVLHQNCQDFDVIVKDGVSSDATLSLIPQEERIRVISQKDTSVYDAMNQAIPLVRGKFLIFMNCGDCFADEDVLLHVGKMIEGKRLSPMDVIYGDYFKEGKRYFQNPAVDRRHFLKEGLCHQSVFFGRELFEQFGLYDTSFRICADYEIMTRFFMSGACYHYADFPVCAYQGGGISEKRENLDVVRQEGNRVRKMYFSRCERIAYLWARIMGRLCIRASKTIE